MLENFNFKSLNPNHAIYMLATGDTSFLDPLRNLVILMETIVALVGAVLLIKNIMEYSSALKQEDDSGMARALKGIIAGILMTGIGSVLAFLGISV